MNTDHYIALIHKELVNSITPTERADLRAWETAAAANKATAKSIRKAWKASEQADDTLPFEVNMDTEFAQVRSKLATNKDAKVVAIKPRRRWLSIAAAAAILLIGTLYMQQYFTQEITWESIAAVEQTQQITLADGTTIWLREGSELSYPTTFSDESRPVKLTGEAFFEVAKDKNRPFSIETIETTITVLGTAFNVRAIAGEGKTNVAVKEGKVKFAVNGTNKNVLLTANEKGVYQHISKILKEQKDETLNDLAWQRERFIFKDTNVADALQVVKDYFGVNVELMNAELSTCKHNARPKTTDDVTVILENIAANFGGELIKIDAKNYRILGGVCSSK